MLFITIMPDGVTGRELADQLNQKQGNLRVILTSGYSPDIAGRDTEFLRANRTFLAKPYTMRVMLETVRKCLDGIPV